MDTIVTDTIAVLKTGLLDAYGTAAAGDDGLSPNWARRKVLASIAFELLTNVRRWAMKTTRAF